MDSRFYCFYLPAAGITGVCHSVWLKTLLFHAKSGKPKQGKTQGKETHIGNSKRGSPAINKRRCVWTAARKARF